MSTPSNDSTGQKPSDPQEIPEALSAPFDPREIKFRPGAVSGNRALALPYVDARVIQDRLDDVLGVTGWQDDYQVLDNGSVVCRLRLRIGDEWITKVDVGGESEQPDEGDRRKAAFSDALKRAAVKFGIGRYLYRLPQVWADFDPKKRQFVRTPTLPAAALPQPASKKAQEKSDARTGASLPANGEELQRRLYDYDARLAKQGLCAAGELVKHVVEAGQKAGHGPDLATWSGPAIQLAVEETKAFEARQREQKAKGAQAGTSLATGISADQVSHLRGLLKRKGRDDRWAVGWAGLPKGASLSALAPEDYARMLKGLQEEPDVELAGK